MAAEADPRIAKFCIPERSAAAELRSLKLQSSRHVRGERPSDELIRRITKMFARQAPAARVRWDEKSLRSEIRYAIACLNPDASPGVPMMRYYKSNKELLEGEGAEWLEAVVVERLSRLALAEDEVFERADSRELVARGLCDPIRLFVKNELHSLAKAKEGRFRLIMSVSVADQVCERVLTGKIQKAEISQWKDLPVKPGMGLNDAGLRELLTYMNGIEDPTGTDISGFDWSVQSWMMEAVACLRTLQYGETPRGFGFGGVQYSMWERRAATLLSSIVVLSDGSVYAQLTKAIQKSGSFGTSASNSWMRGFAEVVVSANAGKDVWGFCAMGDDCVESGNDMSPAEIRSQYSRLGLRVKDVEKASECNNRVEFCAYEFVLGKSDAEPLAALVRPVRPWKMVATFCYRWPNKPDFQDRLDALQHELRWSPERDDCLRLIEELRQSLPE